jgi:hypothetical protein
MHHRAITLRDWIFGHREGRRRPAQRPRPLAFSSDALEERVTPAHFGTFAHAVAAPSIHVGGFNAAHSGTGGSSSSSNSALSTALQTLQTDVLSIESQSGTTIGQLATLRTDLQTLKSDGLSPTSQSALSSFENSLVTSFASGMTLIGNTTLEGQFAKLYTDNPTTQQATDLANAYDALAQAVTSAGITSADITQINSDWSAVLAAKGSTSTATFPYFSLVTGQAAIGRGGEGFGGGC